MGMKQLLGMQSAAFDHWMFPKKPGQVIFKHGQLVQIYRSNLDYTFKAEQKPLPKWSQPQWIMKWLQNSYTLENLDSSQIDGTFSSQQLWEFISREGMKLAAEQWELEEKLVKEDSNNKHVSKDTEGEGEDTGEDEGENKGEDTEEGIEEEFEGGQKGAEGSLVVRMLLCLRGAVISQNLELWY